MQYKSISLKSHTFNIKSNKSNILNAKINILTSSNLNNNLTNNYNHLHSNYLNLDIISSSLIVNEEKDKKYIIAFTDNDYLQSLKNNIKHPYFISNIKIINLKYYLKETNSNLLIIYKNKIDTEINYSALTIDINDMSNINDHNIINVNIHNFIS